jgi:hypothetical protein
MAKNVTSLIDDLTREAFERRISLSEEFASPGFHRVLDDLHFSKSSIIATIPKSKSILQYIIFFNLPCKTH